jgi:hypothetical protein
MSTPLENETTRETATFEHFDKTWTVPAKLRVSHRVAFANARSYYQDNNLAMCHAYLPADELKVLHEIDPDDDQLDAFTDDMAKALGFTVAGN